MGRQNVSWDDVKIWSNLLQKMCQKEHMPKRAHFVCFRGQKTAATSYRTTRLFLFFMTNLYLKQPQRGSNVKWGSSKTSFRIFSLCLSVPFWLPKEMGHVQIGRFLYTPIYLAAKNVVFLDGDNFCKAFAGAQVHISHIMSGENHMWPAKGIS